MPEQLSFPPVIDASMRSSFAECPHKFFRQYLQSLRRPHSSIHLHFGGCFAAGLALFREAHYLAGKPVDEALYLGAREIVEKWGSFPEVEGSAKTLARCVGALEAYIAHYPPSMDHLRPLIEDGRIHTEFSFALPLPIAHPQTGQPLLYSGRFDMLAMLGGLKVIEDDKTTSQLGATWGQQWRLRGQFTGYAWGAAEYGHTIDGVVVRGISILKRDYGHAEVIEQRPRWMIGAWQRQLYRDIARMIEMWRDTAEVGAEAWDQNLDSSCSAYGGCPFLDLCTSEHPDRWLSEFETSPYDPLGVPE